MTAEHRATQLLHIVLSPADASASSHDILMVFKTSTIVEFQFFRGLPGLLFPSFGTHRRACFGNRLVSIRCTCPNHLSRLRLRVSSSLAIPVLFRTSSFVTLSFQVIPSILLSHLWCAASSFLMFAAVVDQVSAPYLNPRVQNGGVNLPPRPLFLLPFPNRLESVDAPL